MSLTASLTASLSLARFTSVWMGWRYLRSQRGEYAAFISWVSVIGLALGVAVLIVVISVMKIGRMRLLTLASTASSGLIFSSRM